MADVTIVPRAAWGAKPPKSRHRIATPTPELWLHHTAGSGANEATMRAIQKFHMDPPPSGRGWSDIAYSFVIDDDAPDVDIFEGRGAGIAGGHTAGRNTVSHAICVIGNFTKKAPKPETLEAVAQLAAYGYRQGWWRRGFTGGHRDAPGASTTCPGDALYALIPQINARIDEILDGPATRFADVAEDHIFYADIEWLAERGITRPQPGPNGKAYYNPDRPVTRGELAAFLRRALGLPAGKATFTDTKGHVFEDDIAAIAAAGITRGTNPPHNTEFSPDAPVTRGQMAAMLVRALGLPAGTATFEDVPSDHLFAKDIAALASAGITRGTNPPHNTEFAPDAPVTRGQMAAFLHRALG